MKNAKNLFFQSYYKLNKNKIIGRIKAVAKLNNRSCNALLNILNSGR